MISTSRYFVNVDNGTIVPWTSEIESNYKFKEITLKVAMAVERGEITAKEVVAQITKQIKPSTLEQMLDAKMKMNVREGVLNLEAQVREDNTQKDGGEAAPYEVEVPSAADAKTQKAARKAADERADKVASVLGDKAGRAAVAVKV